MSLKIWNFNVNSLESGPRNRVLAKELKGIYNMRSRGNPRIMVVWKAWKKVIPTPRWSFKGEICSQGEMSWSFFFESLGMNWRQIH